MHEPRGLYTDLNETCKSSECAHTDTYAMHSREFGSRDKSGIQFVGIPSRLNAQLGQLEAKTELDSTALCAEAKRGGPANP